MTIVTAAASVRRTSPRRARTLKAPLPRTVGRATARTANGKANSPARISASRIRAGASRAIGSSSARPDRAIVRGPFVSSCQVEISAAAVTTTITPTAAVRRARTPAGARAAVDADRLERALRMANAAAEIATAVTAARAPLSTTAGKPTGEG